MNSHRERLLAEKKSKRLRKRIITALLTGFFGGYGVVWFGAIVVNEIVK